MKLEIQQMSRTEPGGQVSLSVMVLDDKGEFVRVEEIWVKAESDGSLVISVDEKSECKLGRF